MHAPGQNSNFPSGENVNLRKNMIAPSSTNSLSCFAQFCGMSSFLGSSLFSSCLFVLTDINSSPWDVVVGVWVASTDFWVVEGRTGGFSSPSFTLLFFDMQLRIVDYILHFLICQEGTWKYLSFSHSFCKHSSSWQDQKLKIFETLCINRLSHLSLLCEAMNKSRGSQATPWTWCLWSLRVCNTFSAIMFILSLQEDNKRNVY